MPTPGPAGGPPNPRFPGGPPWKPGGPKPAGPPGDMEPGPPARALPISDIPFTTASLAVETGMGLEGSCPALDIIISKNRLRLGSPSPGEMTPSLLVSKLLTISSIRERISSGD